MTKTDPIDPFGPTDPVDPTDSSDPFEEDPENQDISEGGYSESSQHVGPGGPTLDENVQPKSGTSVTPPQGTPVPVDESEMGEEEAVQ